jgi:hypothetical protein
MSALQVLLFVLQGCQRDSTAGDSAIGLGAAHIKPTQPGAAA